MCRMYGLMISIDKLPVAGAAAASNVNQSKGLRVEGEWRDDTGRKRTEDWECFGWKSNAHYNYRRRRHITFHEWWIDKSPRDDAQTHSVFSPSPSAPFAS
jgi:hypothetical protein